MSMEARNQAKEVHFTLPAGLWEREKGFFEAFGFNKAVKAGHQYRLFEEELRCSSVFAKVWQAVLEKLPKIARMFSVGDYSLNNKILMSIRAEYATKILTEKKKVEIRRKFSKNWVGERVSLYACKPTGSLVGEAMISEVVVDDPGNIWDRFDDQIGCTKEEFENYTHLAEEVYAIVLEHPKPFKQEVSLEQLSELTNKRLHPPQSYCKLDVNENWGEAVSIAALLQSAIESQEPMML